MLVTLRGYVGGRFESYTILVEEEFVESFKKEVLVLELLFDSISV